MFMRLKSDQESLSLILALFPSFFHLCGSKMTFVLNYISSVLIFHTRIIAGDPGSFEMRLFDMPAAYHS